MGDDLSRFTDPTIPSSALRGNLPAVERALQRSASRRLLLGNRAAREKLYDLFLAKGEVQGPVWNDRGQCKVRSGTLQGRPEGPVVSLIIEARTDQSGNIVELGTGGFAKTLSVWMRDVVPDRPLALKLSTVVQAGRDESKILRHLTEQLLDSKVSPHVIRHYFSFQCKGGPPRHGAWRQIIDDYLVATPNGDDDLLREGLGSPGTGWTRANITGLLYIGLEEGRESLEEFIARRKPLPRPLTMSLTFQILQGLMAMHAAGVLHRDIQSGNVVMVPARVAKRLYRLGTTYYEPLEIQGVDGPLDAKFIDFGVSAAGDIENKYMAQALGLAIYRAPEFVFMRTAQANGREAKRRSGKVGFRYGPETDLFSAGLLIVAMAWKEPVVSILRAPDGSLQWDTIYGGPPPDFLAAVAAEQTRLATLANRKGSDALYWKFTYRGQAKAIAYHMWGMVHLMGMPSDWDWPEVTQDPVYALLAPFRTRMHPIVDAGGWVSSYHAQARLGPRGQEMLRQILAWNPDRRGVASDHLQSGYFASLVVRGAIAKYSERLKPEWGYDPGLKLGSIRAINCKKR